MVADSSRAPIVNKKTHRHQLILAVVEVVAFPVVPLAVHLETQMVVVPLVAGLETHRAADHLVVHQET